MLILVGNLKAYGVRTTTVGQGKMKGGHILAYQHQVVGLRRLPLRQRVAASRVTSTSTVIYSPPITPVVVANQKACGERRITVTLEGKRVGLSLAYQHQVVGLRRLLPHQVLQVATVIMFGNIQTCWRRITHREAGKTSMLGGRFITPIMVGQKVVQPVQGHLQLLQVVGQVEITTIFASTTNVQNSRIGYDAGHQQQYKFLVQVEQSGGKVRDAGQL
jgi:hypothetical protein